MKSDYFLDIDLALYASTGAADIRPPWPLRNARMLAVRCRAYSIWLCSIEPKISRTKPRLH